jgi:hypothetical protein
MNGVCVFGEGVFSGLFQWVWLSRHCCAVLTVLEWIDVCVYLGEWLTNLWVKILLVRVIVVMRITRYWWFFL